MLSILGSNHRLCDGLSRRDLLKVGALGVGGLTFADVLRARAQAFAPTPRKSVIMVYLNGGPSHMDMYDMKPDAPVEYRGEFRPIHTNVPGMDICEHLPMQARIADKFAIIRNMRFRQQGHTSPELYTGQLTGNRPSIGSIVSKLRRDAGVIDSLPPFVSMGDGNHVPSPGFLGKAYETYQPGSRAANLGLVNGVTREQVGDRRSLLGTFDTLRRDLDGGRGSLQGMDAFTEQAMEMITSNRARDAFDVTREPQNVRDLYGRGTDYLLARRLVEAGVPVVTLTPQNYNVPRDRDCNGQWDHHDHVFPCLSAILPAYDRSIYALLTDLHQRGLDQDVAVVIWGEMGRTPRIGAQRGTVGGRDHWPQSGFALMAGGGLRMGQVIGATDARGENPRGRAYTPQNVLATLYYVLGIDPVRTVNDHQGRPHYLLDDREKVAELV
ncbi:MAG: DUF1501 domain-containing protein [Gemmataceae bacterium]|nr:DUF1501 domain-containing protein [Gemmataceae bacterium]